MREWPSELGSTQQFSRLIKFMNHETGANGKQGESQKLGTWADQTPIPSSRIQYYAEADPSLIETIQLGVLLVLARWSGTSVQSFQYLTNVISRVDPLERLQIVVVDADGSPGFYEFPAFKGDLHGHGEVAWIKDGVVQCTSGRGFNYSCYEQNTKTLLESAQA